ncbi:hypothetical protein GJ744_005599 [Endocarpon pusillum]|uniref:Uncharacterized protein n=1 Tax=Endocarpon pusillum TaxID=364733 RepID=A0A8H7AL52_9EURO|nr:hypothetical protein GJ744_005599 [Endocarpon pusillum]
MTEYRSPRQARKLLHVVYVVLGLISLRIIFRLIEFSQGFDTYLPTHEWVPYVFDASPMLRCADMSQRRTSWAYIDGPEAPNSDFTEERKADKLKKKEKKDAKKAEKMEMSELKKINKRNTKANQAAHKREAKGAVTMIV